MEEAPENGKESSHSPHANGMNEWMNLYVHLLEQVMNNKQYIY